MLSSVCMLTEKMHSLKVENYFLFKADILTSSLGHSISDNAERLFQRGWGGGGYQDVWDFAGKGKWSEHKDHC